MGKGLWTESRTDPSPSNNPKLDDSGSLLSHCPLDLLQFHLTIHHNHGSGCHCPNCWNHQRPGWAIRYIRHSKHWSGTRPKRTTNPKVLNQKRPTSCKAEHITIKISDVMSNKTYYIPVASMLINFSYCRIKKGPFSLLCMFVVERLDPHNNHCYLYSKDELSSSLSFLFLARKTCLVPVGAIFTKQKKLSSRAVSRLLALKSSNYTHLF